MTSCKLSIHLSDPHFSKFSITITLKVQTHGRDYAELVFMSYLLRNLRTVERIHVVRGRDINNNLYCQRRQ